MSELEMCCGSSCDKTKLAAEMQHYKDEAEKQLHLVGAIVGTIPTPDICRASVNGQTLVAYFIELHAKNNLLQSKVKHLAEKETKLLAIQQAYTQVSENYTDKNLRQFVSSIQDSFKEVIS